MASRPRTSAAGTRPAARQGYRAKIVSRSGSGIDVDTFLLCVEAQDVAALTRIPGIGRKTAERLLIEMRDRIQALGQMPSAAQRLDPAAGAQAEAYSALVALGYRPGEVTRLLKSIEHEGAGTEELIRRALQAAAR